MWSTVSRSPVKGKFESCGGNKLFHDYLTPVTDFTISTRQWTQAPCGEGPDLRDSGDLLPGLPPRTEMGPISQRGGEDWFSERERCPLQSCVGSSAYRKVLFWEVFMLWKRVFKIWISLNFLPLIMVKYKNGQNAGGNGLETEVRVLPHLSCVSLGPWEFPGLWAPPVPGFSVGYSSARCSLFSGQSPSVRPLSDVPWGFSPG